MWQKLSRLWFVILMSIGLASGLSGCGHAVVKSEQPVRDGYAVLGPASDIGQTFTSNYDGLQGVTLYLDPIKIGSGELVLHLRDSSTSMQDLRSANINLDSISKSGHYTFGFSPLEDSYHRDYYLLLEMQGAGEIQVGTGGLQSYLNGSLYQNGIPQNGQIYFDLTYQMVSLITGLVREAAGWLMWILAGMYLFLLPGWALLSATWPDWEKSSWAEKSGLSLGTGLALSTIQILFLDLLGLQLGFWNALLPGALGALYLLWKNRNAIRRLAGMFKPREWPETLRALPQKFSLPDFLLLITILLVFFTRFWAIRAIDVPMWGDSVQHTVIAQLIMDHGGLFSSWEPYAPYQSLSVHFGFPAHAALFAWISGLPSYTSALILAQLLNAIAVITLLPLAYRFSRKNSWAAVGTLIVAGLLSKMPAYYVNWGRFAQLDGQAILPVGVWLTLDLLDRIRVNFSQASNHAPEENARPNQAKTFSLSEFWIPCLVIGIVLSGMTLGHYRMAFFFLTIFPGIFIAWLLARLFQDKKAFIASVLGVATIAATTFLWFLPWLAHVRDSHLGNLLTEGVITGPQSNAYLQMLQLWRGLANYLSIPLAALAILAILWSLFRKRWEVTALGLWVVTLQAYYLGSALHLPGANLLEVFAIIIWLYMPVSLLVGWLIGEAAVMFEALSPQWGKYALAVCLIVLAFFGANRMRLIAEPVVYNMVTRPDLRAMTWIRQNTPADAKFLVEGFLIYNGSTTVGSDAGWWIPLLASRQNTLPPQYALGNEVPVTAGYSQSIIDLVTSIGELSFTNPKVIRLLCTEGITHIYIGQRAGTVGAGARQLFSAAEFMDRPEFTLVFHQDEVYIFSLNNTFCAK